METFEHLRRADTVLLSTRRRDGSTVHTPVNLVVDDQGIGYFRTWSTSGKARRLRNFPGVRVAPCSFSGRPQGSDQPALASLLSGADAERARTLLAGRFPILHGRLVPLVHRLLKHDTVHYRLAPAEEPTPWKSPPEGQTEIACRFWASLWIMILRGFAFSATGIVRRSTPAW